MGKVGAVILAAGGSGRFGQPKQLLTFRGETLIQRAVRAAIEAGCHPVVVVAGESAETMRSDFAIRDSRIATASAEERARRPITVVENRCWQRGMGTSIRCGLEELPKSVEAVVLLTCDQPFVDASIVARLIEVREKTGKPMVASGYANTLGVPALFDRSCFDALLALPDASGAKSLILSRRDEVAAVPFEDGMIDIDTPEDWARIRGDK